MYLPVDENVDLLHKVKQEMNLSELFFLNTCNRVFYFFVTNEKVEDTFIEQFFDLLQPELTKTKTYYSPIQLRQGEQAVRHIFELTSSLDSLVLGEREILHQMRTAHQFSIDNHLCGDLIKLVLEKAVLAAKSVFTETKIGAKPVSVVSLAVQQLSKLNIDKDARILIVGAGQTNLLLSKILIQHGFNRFSVFNRTLSNASNLAKKLSGNAYLLNDLNTYKDGFDVLITCTASKEYIITNELYQHLLQGDTNRKILLDLSIPYNIDPEVIVNFDVHHIEIEILRALADKNLQARKEEMIAAKEVIERYILDFHIYFHQRMVTKKIQHLPKQIQDITQYAVENVFDKKIAKLDTESQELLHEILQYVEKKYINANFIQAKESIGSMN